MSADRRSPNAAPLPRPADRHQFNQAVYQLVRAIPLGKVMTYGQIAAFIPCPRSLDPLAYRQIRPRWVGYALVKCPPGLPWQRVVNRLGQVSRRRSGSEVIQRVLLQEEGVFLLANGQVDLERAVWHPQAEDLAACAARLRMSWGVGE